ncbi:unnamed protein product [Linum tenue]|uniref:Uncharacterized protein n=1 Tax=Linum tenue TaxID=586396 RepID=A0AAV0Q5Z1_9ROSI|nr:unnamed protein product [Linum tenue]CAI0549541.1 unnamed protein product [Linum tenue]
MPRFLPMFPNMELVIGLPSPKKQDCGDAGRAAGFDGTIT